MPFIYLLIERPIQKRCIRHLLAVVLFFSIQYLFGCDGINKLEEVFRPGFVTLDHVYNFGEVKHTKTFTFQFSNEGDTELIDISLLSSNASFVISPEYIPVLKPRGINSLTQNIEITAVHGSDPGGVGFRDLMFPGINEGQLIVRAKTTNFYGDTLRLSSRSVISAFARIVNVEVQNANGIIPLDSHIGSIFARGVSQWPLRLYDIDEGPITIKNTGNIDLSIRLFRRTSAVESTYDASDFILSADQDTTIGRGGEGTAFRINGNNTISNPELLPILPDGYIYLYYF